ncbi:hypothetical protein [Halosolutus halophilus]|uniref:hypothetical protein n=1 Tax=Halosolutus halophilus TaxID=1552990 RepID=UPI0022350D1E|nr:hypothetical protein [Halosolutus halophilus]
MGLKRGLLAAIIETLPLVSVADATGDGELELVIGPQPSGAAGTVLRHTDNRTVEIGRLVIVLGVR